MLTEPTIRIGEPHMTLGKQDLEVIQTALKLLQGSDTACPVGTHNLLTRITERLTRKEPPCP